MTIWRRLQVDPTRFQIDSGGIFARARARRRSPSWRRRPDGSTARSHPYVPSEDRGWKVFRFVSGRAEAEGTVQSLAFLDEYLRKTRWVRFDTRDGKVAVVNLKVRRGESSSRRAVWKRGRSVSSPPRSTTGPKGQGRAVWEVLPGRESRLALEFDSFQVTRGHRQPHVRGRDLRIEATNGEPRLVERDFFSPKRIEIRMPESEVKDFSFYNAYLPPARAWS